MEIITSIALLVASVVAMLTLSAIRGRQPRVIQGPCSKCRHVITKERLLLRSGAVQCCDHFLDGFGEPRRVEDCRKSDRECKAFFQKFNENPPSEDSETEEVKQ